MYYQQLAPFKTALIVALTNSWGDAARAVSIVGTTACAAMYIYTRDRNCWNNAPTRSLEYLKVFSTRLALCIGFVVFAVTYVVDTEQSRNGYRLSDAVAGGSPLKIGVAEPCKTFPHTILCEYFSTTPDLVNITRQRSNRNVTSMHLRLGDGLGDGFFDGFSSKDCWHNGKDCKWDKLTCTQGVCDWHDRYTNRLEHDLPNIPDDIVYMPKGLTKTYYDQIHPPLELPLVLFTGTFRSNTYRQERDNAYIQHMVEYWQKRGYNVRVRSNGSPDDDFVNMATSRVFVQGGGGYSGFIAKVSDKLGNKVLRHAYAKQCSPEISPFLCTNKIVYSWYVKFFLVCTAFCVECYC